MKIHKIRGQEIGRTKIFQNFSVERFLIYEDESLEDDGVIGRGSGKLAFSWHFKTSLQNCYRAVLSSEIHFSAFVTISPYSQFEY